MYIGIYDVKEHEAANVGVCAYTCSSMSNPGSLSLVSYN